jgi:hypothetical protein
MNRRTTVLAALALVLPAAALAQPAASGSALYICVYRPGPAWKTGQPVMAQDLKPHGAYMKRLFDDGRLLAGGPITDGEGGLAIVRAATPEEAKAIFAADPAITGGVMTGEVHRWTPFFLSDKPLKP